MPMQHFLHVKVNLGKKTSGSSHLVLPWYTVMLQHLTIHLSLRYLSSGRLRRLKSKENFKLLVLKVVVVAYERLSHTRDSKYSDFTRRF